MKNIPKAIFLQIGEQVDKAEAIDFNQLSGVTWSVSKCFKNDLEYIYYPFAQGAIEAAKAEAYSEAEERYKRKIADLNQQLIQIKQIKKSWINRLFNKKGD